MKLYPHQEQALEETKNRNRVAYYLDMGLGKTFVGGEKMMQLGEKTNLLICQKSKIKDWVQHLNDNYKTVATYDLTNKNQFTLFTHANFEKIGVINYELAWRRPELLKLGDFTLMLDESSLIQNSKAKQTKFILKMNPKNVILLSGTPTSGKYENLWTQSKLLGYEISEKMFLAEYVNFKTVNFGGNWITIVDSDNPYKNVERLKNKMREHGAIFMKTEECFELPEQSFVEVKVPKSASYKKFMKNGYVNLDGVEFVGDTTLTKRIRARQLCGAYSKEKLLAFEDLIESTNDRIIVFYNFNDELYELQKICRKLKKPMAVVNGQQKEIENFEKNSDCVLLVQYAAGAMGLNLQSANKIIYFSLPERSELFEQSKKRIHRIGQKNACVYYVMMCENSVEEKIYQALKERKDFTDDLFKNCS